MSTDGEDNVVNKEECPFEQKHSRAVQRFLKVIDKAKNNWEENKSRLREGHDSVSKGIHFTYESELRGLDEIKGEVNSITADLFAGLDEIGGEIGKHNAVVDEFGEEIHVNVEDEFARLYGTGPETGEHNTVVDEIGGERGEIHVNVEVEFAGLDGNGGETGNDNAFAELNNTRVEKGKRKLVSSDEDDSEDWGNNAFGDEEEDRSQEDDSEDWGNNAFGDEEEDRSQEDDSEDSSYLVETSSSDTDESVYDDFEVAGVGLENGSDNEDEESGLDNDVSPPRQATALDEPEGSASNPFFVVGMTFRDKNELKKTLSRYAISIGVNLRIVRSDKKSIKVLCEEGCPFVLYASSFGVNVGFQVKTLFYEHCCSRVYKNRRASAMWLADYFKDKVQEMPKFRTSDMKKEVEMDLKVSVSLDKCKRAKRNIMQEMEGSFKDEFAKLEAYCNELRLSNPGSDVNVELSNEALEQGRRVFKRLYLCFNSSKVGWREGCRPFVGVDGTFLKGKAKGILLTAVGLDANDSIYPLAFGLVQKENTLNWTWFLECVRKSLDLGHGETITLMSDMQKGLCKAVNEVLPRVEHRLCARHIYMNWSKAWRGNLLKDKFFTCAWSSFDEEFKDNLKSLGDMKREAARAVMTYNPRAWVRAYFTGRCKCWSVDNNASESLNAWIKEYRILPVIRMFDGIRIKMMAKWADSEKNVRRWKGDYSPKCIELFEANRYLAIKCRVEFNGDEGYEVREGQDRHTVFLSRGMCTCRAWDLTGIPCQHAVCAMYHAKIDPMSHISHYYHKDTYLASYRTKLQPVRGKKFWDTHTFLPMQPPPIEKLPGRPTEKRIRTEEAKRRRKRGKSAHKETQLPSRPHASEQMVIERLTRRGKNHKCSVCNQEGHNKSTCVQASSSSRPPVRSHTPTQPPMPSQGHTQPPLPSQGPTQPPMPSQGHTQPPMPSQGPTQPPMPSQTPTRRSLRQKCTYKPRAGWGMGIRFDEDTGRCVYNPGLESEVVIEEGTAQEYVRNYADPNKKFAIPNEKELRMSKGKSSVVAQGSRRIQLNLQPNDGPSDVPFGPPGLQWRGHPALTTSQLLAKSKRQILKTKDKGKKTKKTNI